MKKPLISFFLFSILSGYSYPQTVWDLDRCIDTAISNNLSIAQSYISTQVSELGYKQSKLNLLPAFNATASQGVNSGRSVNPVSYSYTTQSLTTNNFNVSGSVILFNGLQNQNRIKQSKANYQSTLYQLEDAKDLLTINVVNAYLQVLFAYELVNTSENQVEGSQEQVKVTQAMVDAGQQARINLLQIKSQLASDKMTLVNAQSQLSTAKLALQQLMNVPVSDSFEINYKIPEIPLTGTTGTVTEMYHKSLTVMPVIQADRQTTLGEEYALKVSRGALWPRLSLGGNLYTNYSSASKKATVTGQQVQTVGYLQSNPDEIVIQPGPIITEQNYPFSDQLNNNLSKSLSLTLMIPILNGRQATDNVKLGELNLRNAQLNEEQGKVTLRKEVEQAYYDLKNALANYEASQGQLDAATASYDDSKTRYDAGMMNATDLLVQKNALIKAQSDLLQAKYDLIFKSKILDYYMGIKITLQ
jgi:outer membrane protein